MAINNNDDISKMFGTSGLGSKKPETDKKVIDMEEVKFSNIDGKGIEDKLKDIPPFLLLGIVGIVVGVMTPFKWAQTVGFLCIIIGVFDKILSKEKKELLYAKIKTLIKFKKKDKTKCPKCQGELITKYELNHTLITCTKCEYVKKIMV